MRAHFKPEFLNRLDDIVVFDSLGTERADRHRRHPAGRAAAAPGRVGGSTLEVSDAAREWLALNGFDPLYGARPLRRLVQTAIGDPLARLLIAGEIRDGAHVAVDARDDRSGLDVHAA